MDEDLRKFVSSAYGQKLINLARLHGKEEFKYGKKFYPIKDLVMWTKIFEEQGKK